MSSAAGSLTEPEVLARAKERLFPDEDAPAYAVADTQFAREEWRPDRAVAPAVRERLAPFNHVRIGGGYPDLVGVGRLDRELVAVERLGDEPPLVAVEAKGYASDGVDARRGIVQAYDRLGEANAAYLAAPAPAVSETDRTLARELNVGILGIEPDGSVPTLEAPRVVGTRTTTEARAIRFQASAQGVTDRSFGLNHPKNYLGYPIAHYADGDTGTLLSRYDVVVAVADARQGAAFLGLIEDAPGGIELTSLGREVVRFAKRNYGTAEGALAAFAGWYRSRKRFVELAPSWGQLARRVVFAYPATELLVTELQALHRDGNREPSLVEFVEYLHELHPSFAVELFVRGDEAVRRRALTGEGELRRAPLENGDAYHAPTVFQLKTMLYHVGILTERGREPHRLEPTVDVWALRESV
ncbi:hypothetical protein [Natronococcus jeotgali]|uniref:Uncharacterized protein n=1 Tax=Natronococcus jeotgali DSM 18795 TaxID=1227498 RepID=L9XVH5_9EURY|nr:hypothetical protein [Natronococcus jeotgali]ELY65426.1 hypothetical protein C492_03896 [Natronococcus jeotgali DSM 18795]